MPLVQKITRIQVYFDYCWKELSEEGWRHLCNAYTSANDLQKLWWLIMWDKYQTLGLWPSRFIYFYHKNYNFLDFDFSINQYFLKTSNQIVCKGPVCKGIHVVCNQTVLKPNQNGNLNLPITILVSHGCLFDWQGQAGPTNYSQVVWVQIWYPVFQQDYFIKKYFLCSSRIVIFMTNW